MTPTEAKLTAQRLEHALAQHGTPQRAAGAKAYLKSDLEFLGVEVPAIRKTGAEFLAGQKDLDHDGVVAVALALWKKPVFELRALAVAILERRVKLLGAADLELLERFVREARTWALSDWLAIHVVGAILRAAPKEVRRLDCWAKDKDFWVRRLALICQRNDFSTGTGDWNGFVRRADSMLEEKEFFIRKAVGWMLRERGKKRPEDVVKFVKPRMKRMAGLTLREATRNLPPGHRAACGV